MHPNPPDGGFVSDLYHLGKRGSFEARKRGENDQPMKLIMGAALVYMGATMLIKEWNKMHGGRVR